MSNFTYLSLAIAGLVLVGPVSAEVQSEGRDRVAGSSGPATLSYVQHPKTPSFMGAGIAAADERAEAGDFAVDEITRSVFRALWQESVSVREERVACIRGHVERGIFRITGAEPVPTEKADSLRVSPTPSLERCGPPEWNGTVHTHITLFRGHPFATLSPSDRHVNGLWRHKWRAEGVFCVLYTETEGYCEYGTGLNGNVIYSRPGAEPAITGERS